MGFEFDALQEGYKFQTDWLEISQELITRFANLTGDRNPLHPDEKVAREAGFSSTIAHGYLLISLIPQLLGVEFPSPSRGIIINREIQWVFKNPVVSGDSICLAALVQKRNVRGKMTTVNLKLLMKTFKTEKVVGEGSALFYFLQR